jgi:hypothetical protein
MIFNAHSNLLGSHAFLSASNWHWINYDADKLTETYFNSQAARRGSELHALAHELIRLGVKLPKTSKTLNMYVNDAIGYRMSSEQKLVYSSNCYGTCDTINFSKDLLRVHDLKNGVNPGSMNQLVVYAALFCLEYEYKPGDISIELRMYQNDDVLISTDNLDSVAHVMSKIVTFDRQIENLKLRG